MRIDFNKNGRSDLTDLKENISRGFQAFRSKQVRQQPVISQNRDTSGLQTRFEAWRESRRPQPISIEPIQAKFNAWRESTKPVLVDTEKIFRERIVEPAKQYGEQIKSALQQDMQELETYGKNAEAQGLTGLMPMGATSLEEQREIDAKNPLYKIPVAGKALKFLNTPSDEIILARGKVMRGEALSQREKNLLNQEQLDLVAGVSSPINSGKATALKEAGSDVIEKQAPKIKELAQKGMTSLDDAMKQKLRFLVRGVDDLVKNKGMKPVDAEKVGFEQYKKLFNSPGVVKGTDDFIKSLEKVPANKRVNIIDYLRTPERVLEKIGMKQHADFLRTSYDNYLDELPKEINRITEWSKRVSPESNERIFRWLDGEKVALDVDESKVAKEVQEYLGQWADRLKLPKDKRITKYINHIFEDASAEFGEIDPEIARMIDSEVAGSVYNPFLQKRQGGGNYIRDTWRALDAYVKRGTRKANLDPALEQIKNASENLEQSQFNYIKKYIDGVNMRPEEIDILLDNLIKSSPLGYKYGPRPTATLTKKARQMTYRGMLGLNVSSALRNLSQGANTYAELGERWTLSGYAKVTQNLPKMFRNIPTELDEVGILGQDILQDRSISATKKFWQQTDEGLFYLFNLAEKINRGAAYWGAKSKYLAQGLNEEQAISKAKDLVRKTQFTFGSIDTPVALQSDLAKTFMQFQSFGLKQAEFLFDKVKAKEYAGLVRYIAATIFFTETMGKLFGMEYKDMIPSFRFGVPPTLQLAQGIVDIGKTKDDFGNELDPEDRLLNKNLVRGVTNYIPAGSQARKTIQGIQAVNEGGVYSESGRLRYPVEPGIRPILFGPNNTDAARDYFDGGNVLGEKQTEHFKSLIDSGMSPEQAYKSIPRKTKKDEKPGFFSSLFNKEEDLTIQEPSDPLLKAISQDTKTDTQKARIREIFRTEGITPSQIQEMMEKEGLGTYADGQLLLIGDLGVDNGARPNYLFQVLDTSENFEVDAAYYAKEGVLTNAVVDYWVDNGMEETTGKYLKNLIKNAKASGTAKTGTRKKINVPKTAMPSMPKVSLKAPKLVIPKLSPISELEDISVKEANRVNLRKVQADVDAIISRNK